MNKVGVEQVNQKKLQEFGLLVGLFLSFVFGGLIPWLHQQAWPLWPWFIAVGLWLPALFKPQLLGLFYRTWMGFGSVMGLINTRIILMIVFFGVVLPIGWVMRGPFQRPLLQLQLDGGQQTYRVLSQQRSLVSMEKPF